MAESNTGSSVSSVSVIATIFAILVWLNKGAAYAWAESKSVMHELFVTSLVVYTWFVLILVVLVVVIAILYLLFVD